MTTNEAREEYRRLREQALYDGGRAAEFDASASAIAGEGASPERWVAAAHRAVVGCRRCGGTGRFITGSLNGQPVGPGGPCFRCDGKGMQNAEDGRRNFGYDRYSMVRAFRADMESARAHGCGGCEDCDGEDLCR